MDEDERRLFDVLLISLFVYVGISFATLIPQERASVPFWTELQAALMAFLQG
jgi:hypothetical protein